VDKRKRIVVVGDGFGGLVAIRELAKDKDLLITVIDRSNHHLFQPLLYQVATALLTTSEIAMPTRAVFKDRKNVEVVMAEVTDIDKENKIIFYDTDKSVRYDYLVLAMGAQTSYFGNDAWRNHTIGLKSIRDALEIRKQILLAFEEAEKRPEQCGKYLNFMIVGGGPTGVELAGAISELTREILRKEYRYIDTTQTRITLIDAGTRLLSAFAPDHSEYAQKQLEKRGVTVMLNTMVSNIDSAGVQIKDGPLLEAHLIIWAAGVEGNPFGQKLGVPLTRAKTVLVNQFCSLDQYPDIFVIGDMAAFMGVDGKPLPGVSPVAMQQGRYVGKLIREELRGTARSKPFTYFDKGSMAIIGRSDAVAQTRLLKLRGFMGWMAWLFVHILYLASWRNRIFTFMSWVWSYITFGAAARLIPNLAQAAEPVPQDEHVKFPDRKFLRQEDAKKDIAKKVEG
jgi:NADH:ubiquinone reductase (H+-translocating)